MFGTLLHESRFLNIAATTIAHLFQAFIQIRSALRDRISSRIASAQVTLSRAYRRKSIQQHLLQGEFCPTIYYHTSTTPKEAYIIGEFTSPQWKVEYSHQKNIPLKYDRFFQAYKVRIFIKEGARFKFIIDHEYVTSPDYCTFKDQTGMLNNIFTLSRRPILTDNNGELDSIMLHTFSLTAKSDNAHLLCSYDQDIESINMGSQLNLSEKVFISKLTSNHVNNTIIKRKDPFSLIKASSSFTQTDNSVQLSNNNPKRFRFACGTSNIKRDDKGISEDAIFTSDYAIGLADGVGGWSEFGSNSAEFSSELMHSCLMIINSNERVLDPITILSYAYQSMKSVGSSTALLCVSNEGQLAISNLGDSGFMHIKFMWGEPFVMQKSQPQQHGFNIPYQLSKVPDNEYMQKLAEYDSIYVPSIEKISECTFCQDSPEDSDYFQICNASAGDVILLASDGVLDNLFDNEILAIMSRVSKANALNVNMIATEIANAAYVKSKMNADVSSPFNLRLESHSHIVTDGGKEDDISVVVALIC